MNGGANSTSCTYGCGTVFKTTSRGALTTLYSFCSQTNCADGSAPSGSLVQGTDGNFYGTAIAGGASGDGTVFKITTSGTLTTLHSFNGTDGRDANGGLVQGTDGNFYGATSSGGTNGQGTVFKVTPRSVLTTLHSFDGTDGSTPNGPLTQGTNGNFYGTTIAGGNRSCGFVGCGTVFEITPGGTLTTLYIFHGPDGYSPDAGLLTGTSMGQRQKGRRVVLPAAGRAVARSSKLRL